ARASYHDCSGFALNKYPVTAPATTNAAAPTVAAKSPPCAKTRTVMAPQMAAKPRLASCSCRRRMNLACAPTNALSAARNGAGISDSVSGGTGPSFMVDSARFRSLRLSMVNSDHAVDTLVQRPYTSGRLRTGRVDEHRPQP